MNSNEGAINLGVVIEWLESNIGSGDDPLTVFFEYQTGNPDLKDFGLPLSDFVFDKEKNAIIALVTNPVSGFNTSELLEILLEIEQNGIDLDTDIHVGIMGNGKSGIIGIDGLSVSTDQDLYRDVCLPNEEIGEEILSMILK